MPSWSKESESKAVAKLSKAPLIVEQKCLVCKSPHRHLVDQMLVSGVSYSEIERQFKPVANIPRRSVANHKEFHLGYEEAGIREIIEREAKKAQSNYEDGVSRVITKNAYLDLALQKGWDALIEGLTIVEPKDAVKIIDQIQKLQEHQTTTAIDELRVQFQVFMQAVKEVVPKTQWEDIVLRTGELAKKQNSTFAFEEPTPAVDAMVVSLPGATTNT